MFLRPGGWPFPNLTSEHGVAPRELPAATNASEDGVGDEGADALLEGIPMKDRSVEEGEGGVVAAAQEGMHAPTKRDLTLEMWKVCSLCVVQSWESPKQLCSCRFAAR